MKKKIIFMAIVILIIVVITIIFFILKNNTNNSKIIYSRSITSGGIITRKTTINIYNNGVITKECSNITMNKEEEKKVKQISEEDFKEIKKAIKDVEKSKLNRMDMNEYLKENGLAVIAGSDYFESINLNKKIVLENSEQICKNEEIDKLYELISNIETKYFKED